MTRKTTRADGNGFGSQIAKYNSRRRATTDGIEIHTLPRSDLVFLIHRVIRSVEVGTGMDKLDLSSKSVLTFIGEAESRQRVLKISDVVHESGFGTAPTVYSRLALLEWTGWIKCVQDPEDGRAKHVRLTPLARHTFALMSAEMQKLLTGTSRARRRTRIIGGQQQAETP
jgi:DNA-binding MarR family transcriptional regulator